MIDGTLMKATNPKTKRKSRPVPAPNAAVAPPRKSSRITTAPIRLGVVSYTATDKDVPSIADRDVSSIADPEVLYSKESLTVYYIFVLFCTNVLDLY